jgi:hypothetical protein
MLGFILKLLFFFMTIMVILNIFLPEEAHKLLIVLSEYTSIELVNLEKYLKYITEFTQDTFSEVKEQITNLLSKD